MSEFILSFDIPRKENALRVRVFRLLTRIDAKRVHDSFWKSDRLNELIEIARMIKRADGDARILEEKFVF
jgi:hypothetical protein